MEFLAATSILDVISTSTILAAILGFLAKVLLDRLTLANKRDVDLDIDMRKRRLEAYPKLWKLTELLPKWPRNTTLTFEELENLQHDLMHWYFNVGGFLLSRSTFDTAYRPLQDKLAEISRLDRTVSISPDGDQSNGARDLYEEVRVACSMLRSALTRDVQSRREVPFWSLNW